MPTAVNVASRQRSRTLIILAALSERLSRGIRRRKICRHALSAIGGDKSHGHSDANPEHAKILLANRAASWMAAVTYGGQDDASTCP